MEKIRKISVLAGLCFEALTVIAVLLDSYSEMPLIKEFVKNETTINIHINHSIPLLISFVVISLLLVLLFYYLSWKGNKKAIFFLFAIYLIELVLILIEWKPVVNLEITDFVSNLASLTDGIILCTLILKTEKNNI